MFCISLSKEPRAWHTMLNKAQLALKEEKKDGIGRGLEGGMEGGKGGGWEGERKVRKSG